jgi:hypothetical protein
MFWNNPEVPKEIFNRKHKNRQEPGFCTNGGTILEIRDTSLEKPKIMKILPKRYEKVSMRFACTSSILHVKYTQLLPSFASAVMSLIPAHNPEDPTTRSETLSQRKGMPATVCPRRS